MADILSWDKAIDKDVKTIDKKKVGKIRAVTTDYIQIRKGKVDKKYYFVPKHYIQGYDGNDIWLAINEDEVKQFESEKELPLASFDSPQYREWKSIVEKNIHSLQVQFHLTRLPLSKARFQDRAK